ncbi:MAG: F0F1 ATP synthase subunit delta [Lachnospiraceae bacterium]|nr:F0F1 ATP synthase subunit delta [Lachnospiraceae bacterium]
MAKLVAGTYGDALFELAVEEKKEKEFLEEVLVLQQVLSENPDFSALMNHPKITKEEKEKVLLSVFEGKFSAELTGFFKLILQKDRYSETDAIIESFIARMKEHQGIGTAYVSTATALTDKQKAEIEKKLLATTSYKEMEMHYEEDASLIGGMMIRIGDRIVDSSIKTKLERLTKELYSLQIG